MKHQYSIALLFVLLLLQVNAQEGFAQEPSMSTTSASPFLRVAPDARGAAMGEAGAASPGDVNSIYWNPAKLVYVPGGKGMSLSYSPWLRQSAANMWISQFTGFFMLDRNQAVGASLVYFNQGTISLKDMNRQSTGELSPREFALTATYSRKLSEYVSLAASLRYVYSNLFGSAAAGLNGTPSHAVAGDVGAYFQSDPAELNRVNFALGATISNLGTQANYGTDEKYFLPSNVRVGTGLTYRFGDNGRFTVALDANKLMLPSRPIYDFSGTGTPSILRGKDPNRGYFNSIFGSFSDSPDGFSGELKEFSVAGGLEFWANEYFAVRGGYFRESARDGDRRYFSAGAGVRYNGMGIDASYLVPERQNHPLAETVRLTLTITPGPQQSRNALVYSSSRYAGKSYGAYRSGSRRPNVARPGDKKHQMSIYKRKQKGQYTKNLRKKQYQRQRRTKQHIRRSGYRK